MKHISEQIMQQMPKHIHLIQVPVPYSLKSVNCYLFPTSFSGWGLIDTGCGTNDTREFWKLKFLQLGILPGQLTDIYITHYHPDHMGLAGWLQQEHGAQVHMEEADWKWACQLWENVAEQADLVEQLYRNNGCPPELAAAIRQQFIDQRNDTVPLPENVLEMHPGDSIYIAENVYELMKLPGHADHMLGFWDRHQKVFIAADSILPHITPNVGIWPRCSPNPLDDYFQTLYKIKQLNPMITLPGHGNPLDRTIERVEFIVKHHQKRLHDMCALIHNGLSSAYEVADQYFRLNRLTTHQIRFALSETLAHLEYLVNQKQLTKLSDTTDVYLPITASNRDDSAVRLA